MLAAERNRVFESWIDAHKAILFKVARVYGATHSDREALGGAESVKFAVRCAARTFPHRRGSHAKPSHRFKPSRNFKATGWSALAQNR